ncbi:14600_t:CDS:2, partial [Acaulospora colombiana]
PELLNHSQESSVTTEFQKIQIRESLMARWRYPSLTIHKIDVSGPNNTTTIPRKAEALVSMRIVPDQELDEIVRNFKHHVRSSFAELKTDNYINITINSSADWWLGDITSKFYKVAEQAIEE